MTSKEWLELIKEHEEKIIESGEKAYADAMNNNDFRFIVELEKDGNIYSWYDVAGGTSCSEDSFNGNAIVLMIFCFRGYEPEITEEDVRNKLIECGFENRIKELQNEAEEYGTTLDALIINEYGNDELYSVIQKCMQDAIDFEIAEYARNEVECELERTKSGLKNCIEYID